MSQTTMVTQVEHDYLVLKLTEHLSPVETRTVLGSVLPPACMEQIALLPLPAAYALEAVRVCMAAKWQDEPPWLFLLMQLLPPEPRTDAIRTRIAVRPTVPDPVQARILATELPFVDRKDLRDKLATLRGQLPVRPVLVVSGETLSGKSYSAEYIDHLAVNGLEYDAVRVKLPQNEDGLSWGPEQLAADILTGMGVSVESLSPSFLTVDTNAARWPKDLAGRVLAEGFKRGRFWIVLDGFVGQWLREETRRFITAIAEHLVESTIYRKAFRLILLDFERSYFTIPPGKVDLDLIKPLVSFDVRQCVTEILTRTPAAPAELEPDALVTRIWDDLPTDATRTQELHQRLVDLMEELRNGQ